MFNNDFGDFLKKEIDNANLSLRETGRKANVSSSYLSKILKGKREPPSPDILRRLAQILNCPYIELMKKAGYINEKDIETKVIEKLSDIQNKISELKSEIIELKK